MRLKAKKKKEEEEEEKKTIKNRGQEKQSQ